MKVVIGINWVGDGYGAMRSKRAYTKTMFFVCAHTYQQHYQN